MIFSVLRSWMALVDDAVPTVGRAGPPRGSGT